MVSSTQYGRDQPWLDVYPDPASLQQREDRQRLRWLRQAAVAGFGRASLEVGDITRQVTIAATSTAGI